MLNIYKKQNEIKITSAKCITDFYVTLNFIWFNQKNCKSCFVCSRGSSRPMDVPLRVEKQFYCVTIMKRH